MVSVTGSVGCILTFNWITLSTNWSHTLLCALQIEIKYVINQAITRDQIELMRGQFHLWVHVIISMVADVKSKTTCA